MESGRPSSWDNGLLVTSSTLLSSLVRYSSCPTVLVRAWKRPIRGTLNLVVTGDPAKVDSVEQPPSLDTGSLEADRNCRQGGSAVVWRAVFLRRLATLRR